jgi:hypothetical protein
VPLKYHWVRDYAEGLSVLAEDIDVYALRTVAAVCVCGGGGGMHVGMYAACVSLHTNYTWIQVRVNEHTTHMFFVIIHCVTYLMY